MFTWARFLTLALASLLWLSSLCPVFAQTLGDDEMCGASTGCHSVSLPLDIQPAFPEPPCPHGGLGPCQCHHTGLDGCTCDMREGNPASLTAPSPHHRLPLTIFVQQYPHALCLNALAYAIPIRQALTRADLPAVPPPRARV